MQKHILAAGLLAALALPANAENPVGDHADLWDAQRAGTRDQDPEDRARAGRQPAQADTAAPQGGAQVTETETEATTEDSGS